MSVEVEVENCDSGVLAPGEAAATIRWREVAAAERVVRDFTDIAVVEVECMGLMPWAVDFATFLTCCPRLPPFDNEEGSNGESCCCLCSVDCVRPGAAAAACSI